MKCYKNRRLWTGVGLRSMADLRSVLPPGAAGGDGGLAGRHLHLAVSGYRTRQSPAARPAPPVFNTCVSNTSSLASHQGELGSIPGRVTGFSQVGIVSDDAVGRRFFSGISRFPRPFIPTPLHIHFNRPPSALKTSLGKTCTRKFKVVGNPDELSMVDPEKGRGFKGDLTSTPGCLQYSWLPGILLTACNTPGCLQYSWLPAIILVTCNTPGSCRQYSWLPGILLTAWNNPAVRPLVSHQGEPGSMSGGGSAQIFAYGNCAGRCHWSAGFFGDLPFPPPLHSGAAPSSARFTLIGSLDLAVKNHTKLSTPLQIV
ncbi:hypothetical protein PR048_017047 [Dryococelus australis]|uniref:Uncharacterized protein n=1 Tax=Dryococelus australis TaxID=614101 RepID=A0ABQ9H8E9_9NEOP|nr:hypothetical protein PR048_017047 [Dryococelus australis]